MTDALALWGALTGTLGVFLAAWALIWQIRSRREAPRPNLGIELSMAAHKPFLFVSKGIPNAVLIHITNRGPLRVRVVACGFLRQGDETQELTFGPLYSDSIPADIGPQQALSVLLDYDGARKAVALSKPLIAWIRTDTGQRFDSPRTQVIRLGTEGYVDNLKPTLPWMDSG